MNEERLNLAINNYKAFLQNDKYHAENEKQERQQRIKYFSSFNREKFMKLSKYRFLEFIKHLWANNNMRISAYDCYIEMLKNVNHDFKELKKQIASFLFGVMNIKFRWDNFKITYLQGNAFKSELLGHMFPSDYALYNKKTLIAMNYLKNKKIYNRLNKNQYFDFCEDCKYLAEKLKENDIKYENLLDVDYFLWHVYDLVPQSEKDNEIIIDIDIIKNEIQERDAKKNKI